MWNEYIISLIGTLVFADTNPNGLYGIAPEQITNYDANSINNNVCVIMSAGAGASTELAYSSYIFTPENLILFSYEDGTQLEVYDSSGNPVSFTPNVLDKGEHIEVDTSRGIYLVAGSNKFAVLTGDATTSGVSGYYAMDAEGKGTSREFYTYAMPDKGLVGHCEFIVFAYADNTEVTVQQEISGVYTNIAVVTLNQGEHWADSDIFDTYLHITADKPVSALTCHDQSYFVPSTDGRWSGTEFYTYVSDVNNGTVWPMDLTVIAYDDDTVVSIKDSNSLEVIWEGALDSGQAQVVPYSNGANKYFTITASNPITASVQTWVSLTSGYNQGLFIPDRNGTGIGTDLIGSTLSDGYLWIVAHTDNTQIDLYNSQTGVWQADYTLDTGQSVNASPGNGLWRIISDKAVSAYSGKGTAIAHFAPLAFNRYPLTLEKTDDVAEGGCVVPGDDIIYTLHYANNSNNTINNCILTDVLPAGVDFGENVVVSAEPDPNELQDPNNFDPNNFDPNSLPAAIPTGEYHWQTHTVTWDIGTLAPGDSNSVSIQVIVNTSALPLSVLRNRAVLTSDIGTVEIPKKTNVCCWDNIGVIYVDDSAPEGGNGTNWVDAYKDLRDAIAKSHERCSTVNGQIWVAKGLYKPGTDTADTFEIPANESVYGGFAGWETSIDQRDIKANPTILTGYIGPDNYGNIRRNETVVTMGDNSLLDGLIVRDSGAETSAIGYGIFGKNVDFIVENCVIEDNLYYGLYAENSNISIKWCMVQNNGWQGIYHIGSVTESIAINVENCLILENARDGFYTEKSIPVIYNNQIGFNGAGSSDTVLYYGLYLYYPKTDYDIRNNTVIYNVNEGIRADNSTNIPLLNRKVHIRINQNHMNVR